MLRKHDKRNFYRGLGMLIVLSGVVGCANVPTTPNANGNPTTANIAKGVTSAKNEGTNAAAAPSGAVSAPPGPSTAATAADASASAADTVKKNPEDYANLWDRIRAGYGLPKLEHPYVVQEERWFANNPDYMERMLQRANLYLYHIVQEVEKRHMPAEIALLPAIESAYSARAYSRARAAGLWQFIPSTGRLYGLKSNWWYDGRRDVMASTKAALDYLEKLHDDFNGDWQLAIAAYNCGEGKVQRAIIYNKRRGLPTDFVHLIPRLPVETRHYLPKLMAMANIVADPAKFGLELAEIPNSPYFVRVDAGSQIDLNVVAKLLKVPVADVYAMNPGFNRWATAPNGPHELLIPVSAKDDFLQALSELPPDQRLQWARHHVVRGDTLGRIAHRYQVSIAAIKTTNHLHSNLLRLNQSLLIPVSGRRLLVATRAQSRRERLEERSTPRATARPAVRHVAAARRVRIVHRVRPGESLWSIAHRYNVLVAQLMRWNALSRTDLLRIGQRLMIWTRAEHMSATDDSANG